MQRRETLTALSLILISVLILILIPFQIKSTAVSQSRGLITVTPRTFPTLMAAVMLLMGIFHAIGVFRKSKTAGKDDSISKKKDWATILLSFVILLIYSLILEKVGYIISTFLLSALLLKIFGAKPWQIAAVSIILPPLLFYGFQYLFVYLPKGIFP